MNRKKSSQQDTGNETRRKILQQAEELFVKFGFSRVTMSEIVRNLGMSKKTLYQFFPNKKGLIKAVISMNQSDLIEKVDTILNREDITYIEKLKEISGVLSQFLSKVSGTIIDDLKRHVPDIWKDINEFKRTVSLERIRKILTQGIENGLFRNDIDSRLISSIYLFLVEGFLLQKPVLDYSFSLTERFEAVFKIFYSGILSSHERKSFLEGENEDEK